MKINFTPLLLDCTLRDGGYVNNWEFDTQTALAVRDALYESGIRYIELGILEQGGVVGKQTKFSTFEEVKPLLVDRKADCHYCLMLTQEEYRRSCFSFPEAGEETADVIRLAFFKTEVDEAIQTGRMLKEKGYLVFLQAMATFMYSDKELAELLEKVNQLKPYSFYMVDSFSTLYNDDVAQIKQFVLQYLDNEILFGLHAHNNLQMAFSNVIEFIHGESEHRLIVDGSIFGMGRGAGNAPIELVMEYVNKKMGGQYCIDAIMSAYETYIEPIFKRLTWGYSMPYFLTASKEMNSVYAWYLMNNGITNLSDLSKVMDHVPLEDRYTMRKDSANHAIEQLKGNKE